VQIVLNVTVWLNSKIVYLRPILIFIKSKIIMATIKLTTQDFKDKIFDYTKSNEWSFSGELPAIIDFYADWCQPCKMVAPILEELSDEYAGKINIYKVDTEKEQELSSVFGIRSIPSILFIPKDGQPMMQPGALPKDTFVQVIEDELIKEKVEN